MELKQDNAVFQGHIKFLSLEKKRYKDSDAENKFSAELKQCPPGRNARIRPLDQKKEIPPFHNRTLTENNRHKVKFKQLEGLKWDHVAGHKVKFRKSDQPIQTKVRLKKSVFIKNRRPIRALKYVILNNGMSSTDCLLYTSPSPRDS